MPVLRRKAPVMPNGFGPRAIDRTRRLAGCPAHRPPRSGVATGVYYDDSLARAASAGLASLEYGVPATGRHAVRPRVRVEANDRRRSRAARSRRVARSRRRRTWIGCPNSASVPRALRLCAGWAADRRDRDRARLSPLAGPGHRHRLRARDAHQQLERRLRPRCDRRCARR